MFDEGQAELRAALHVAWHRRPGRKGDLERHVLEKQDRVCTLGHGNDRVCMYYCKNLNNETITGV